MSISAKIIAHSIYDHSPPIVTMELRYPRFIHAEFMTHRVFSRNASSSRAIPIERMIQDVENDPAMPVAWGSNKPGMQAGEELTGRDLQDAKCVWETARDQTLIQVRKMAATGAHKQIANRLLEPFGHISVIVTATEWDNFFALRCHPDADPTMRALAEAMRETMVGSTPERQQYGKWHLPYVTDKEYWDLRSTGQVNWRHLAMISAARCARVSYLNHDGTKPSVEKDIALAEKLLTSRHMSPFEHQALANPSPHSWSGNFRGWLQHRKMIEE